MAPPTYSTAAGGVCVIERHPLSALFGDMPDRDYQELVADIRKQGVLDPITVYEGKVLDGWHRYCAAHDAGQTVDAVEYEGADPLGFVLSKNLHRRQLTASQRAAIAIEGASLLGRGNPLFGASTELAGPAPESQSDLAEKAGVGVSTIGYAKAAADAGLGEEVRNGDISAKAAAQQAREDDNDTPAPPKPKKPTKLEKAEALIAELRAEILGLEDARDELLIECEASLAVDRGEEHKTIAELMGANRRLKSLLNARTNEKAALQRECNAYRRQLGYRN